MKKLKLLTILSIVSLVALPLLSEETATVKINGNQIKTVIDALSSRYPLENERIKTGVAQAAQLWTEKDGSSEEFKNFCLENFTVSGPSLVTLFNRFERKFEHIRGHNTSLMIELNRELHEDTGPLIPVDQMFATFNPSAHMIDDLFNTKLAFVILLNFPVKKFDEIIKEGPAWSREQWAAVRLTGSVQYRVPADVIQTLTNAYTAAEKYIGEYNIYMDRIVDKDNKYLFVKGPMLISHWGLRDYIKQLYANPAANLSKQKIIYTIMERIISQEIPQDVINNGKINWDPIENTVNGKPAQSENDIRYLSWLNIYKAETLKDSYYSDYPTTYNRSFKLEREMSEEDVEKMFDDVLSAPVAKDMAALIEKRLGRTLQPFDMWYDGFKSRSSFSPDRLNAIVRKKYPTKEAFQKDIPNILMKLGFNKKTAFFLESKIEVDAGRGSGHAIGAEMRTEKSHLRVRIPATGMDYQGFNTAMHELGHCVEQTFSIYNMDHTLLRGIPNTAFTEAFAFIFQAKDLEVLGLGKTDAMAQALQELDTYWMTREIAGVALVDMKAWRWMYSHPQATPAEFKNAVMTIARDIWNKYNATVYGIKDSPILAIYSHMINNGLYLPNYPIGHIIGFQIKDYYKTHPLAKEMERMCSIGSIAPEEWMQKAVGARISPAALIKAAKRALPVVKK